MSFIKCISPEKGDLVRVKRKQGYYHFGIAIGTDEVIHFSGSTSDSVTDNKDVEIRDTNLDSFLRGDELEVWSPFDSCFSRDEVCERALSYVGEGVFNGKRYSLVDNNCEHFARYIYYGKKSSQQVNKVSASVSSILGAAAVLTAGAFFLSSKKKNAGRDAHNDL